MIKTFASKLVERLTENKVRNGYNYFDHYEIDLVKGRKYTKLVRVEVSEKSGERSGNCVVCFVDNQTGDVFKPASWSAPAKHARGNVNSPTNGMEAIDAEGFVYYLKYHFDDAGN